MDQQVVKFVSDARAAGKSNEQIQQELAGAGWSGAQIAEALGGSSSVSGTTFRYAGFWIRFVASIIDSIIGGVLGFVVGLVFPAEVSSYIAYGIGIVYTLGFWIVYSATPGKMVLGLKIIALDGSKLSPLSAVIRYFSQILSAIPLMLGFIWVGFDKHKQGWHDKLASTYVIHK